VTALAQVASLSKEMYDGAIAAHAAHVQARALSDRLTADPTLKAQVDSLAPAAARGGRGGRGGGGGGFGAAAAAGPPTLEGVSNAMLAAAMSMQEADVAPTARQLDAVNKARAQYKIVMARWKTVSAKAPAR
jgi:hypothetical protein